MVDLHSQTAQPSATVLKLLRNASYAAFATAAVTTTALAQAANNHPSWQPVTTIESAALKHIERRQAGASSRTQSRVKALDRRLKLAKCGTALETFVPSNAIPGATQIVGVRCSRPYPWKIYVPVSTVTFENVVVASRPLRRGVPIGKGDVHVEERDVTRIRKGYLTEIGQLEGRILKRDIQSRTVLSQNNLDTQDIITRGQNVTLLARNAKMNVRMRGEALSSAGKNERIRVKNLSSQRVIEGIVQSRQIVLVDH